MPTIIDLSKRVSKLSKDNKELFKRLFTIDVSIGRLSLPKEMHSWVKKQFGSLSKIQKQHIVRVDNNITKESSLFNEVRAFRPMVKSKTNALEEIEKSRGGAFDSPTKKTPADTFGRIRSPSSITASNIAKYDKWHGLIIFNEHNPLLFTKKNVLDHMDVAEKWIKKAHKADKDAKYPYILWHCLWRSGASMIHGHMQLLLPRKKHYANIDALNHARQEYISNYGTDYFDDLFKIHKSLGLAVKKGSVKVLVHLTPKKEKEVVIIAPKLSKQFSSVLYKVLASFRDDMGVESFTVGIALPPMTKEKGWEGFPVVARMIDRGSLSQKTTDIGAMEFFAGASVVSSDPYKVMNKIKKRL